MKGVPTLEYLEPDQRPQEIIPGKSALEFTPTFEDGKLIEILVTDSNGRWCNYFPDKNQALSATEMSWLIFEGIEHGGEYHDAMPQGVAVVNGHGGRSVVYACRRTADQRTWRKIGTRT